MDACASLSASAHGAGRLNGSTGVASAELFDYLEGIKKSHVIFEGRLPRRQGVKLHEFEETAVRSAQFSPRK